jgi:FdrA protein
MTARHLELRRGSYRDSVRLMQISQTLRGAPGVSAALVAMATDLNLELAADMGFTAPPDAAPNDMVIAVAAVDDAALAGAIGRLETELREKPAVTAPGSAGTPPRTVGSAVRRSGSGIVLVSTPGRYAFFDAMDALDAGASVMLFSDNVPVAQEIQLKDVAAQRGLLVMGPDCGTALVAGVGLGFANVVRPGPVGLVAASGTGAQQVMSLLGAAGVGVSHCLGVGGRDLSSAVAGRSTLAALDALDADDATELIVVVSKPPAPEVAERVRAHAGHLATPVVFALLGIGQADLTAVVEGVLERLGRPVPASWPAWHPTDRAAPRGGALRGLFAGGTLCDEAMAIASARLGPIRSNIPLRPDWALVPGSAGGHTMVDFGDDDLTRGRPHPMIDPTVRLEHLAAEAADPSCAAILLDVVLGHAADPDPAATLAPAIAAARERGVAVVVSLTGTTGDAQGLHRQAEALCESGAAVFLSNAEAARFALDLVEPALTTGGVS